MTPDVREAVLELLAGGDPVARAVIQNEIARRLEVPPENRQLRMKVSRALRELEEEGRLVDGGPEVWLTGR